MYVFEVEISLATVHEKTKSCCVLKHKTTATTTTTTTKTTTRTTTKEKTNSFIILNKNKLTKRN